MSIAARGLTVRTMERVEIRPSPPPGDLTRPAAAAGGERTGRVAPGHGAVRLAITTPSEPSSAAAALRSQIRTELALWTAAVLLDDLARTSTGRAPAAGVVSAGPQVPKNAAAHPDGGPARGTPPSAGRDPDAGVVSPRTRASTPAPAGAAGAAALVDQLVRDAGWQLVLDRGVLTVVRSPAAGTQDPEGAHAQLARLIALLGFLRQVQLAALLLGAGPDGAGGAGGAAPWAPPAVHDAPVGPRSTLGAQAGSGAGSGAGTAGTGTAGSASGSGPGARAGQLPAGPPTLAQVLAGIFPAEPADALSLLEGLLAGEPDGAQDAPPDPVAQVLLRLASDLRAAADLAARGEQQLPAGGARDGQPGGGPDGRPDGSFDAESDVRAWAQALTESGSRPALVRPEARTQLEIALVNLAWPGVGAAPARRRWDDEAGDVPDDRGGQGEGRDGRSGAGAGRHDGRSGDGKPGSSEGDPGGDR